MSSQLVIIAISMVAGAAVMAASVFVYRRLRENSREPAEPESHEETPSQQDDTSRANLLLATMSHEIRTPLNGVLGMLQLLDGSELSREQRRIVQMIVDSGQILSQVVDDYLAFYRLEAGKGLTASPGVCDLEDVVHQTMMLFQGLAYDKGLEFVLVGDPQAPHVVRADALRLRQVLSNLVLNAIKYTNEGEVTVSIDQVSDHTEIAVSDTGPGMSEEDVAELFEPFFRAEANASTEKGSGLGLVIARHLTEVLGGELEVDSELGVGTTFTLRFDFETLVPAPPTPPELPWEDALIVGGSPSASMALVDLLERFGLKVRSVDAAGAFRAEGADLVFDFSGRAGPVSKPGATRVDVLWLSDPKAHLRDSNGEADNHVLIQPFSRATVHHILSELASGAKRTSTIDRWRHSMAESYPLSILIAEDDVVSAQVIAGMLENLGYAPTLATSGPEAVEALRGQTFDVALLDVNLPEFGGVEILGRVETNQTWWIAMSASVQPELRKRCREAGFRDFLTKPLASGALQSALLRGARRDSGIAVGSEAQAPTLHIAGSNTAGSNTADSRAMRQMRDLFAQSPDAYRDLLKSHLDQTDLLCADLEQGLSNIGDPETARRAVHTLQAAAASFGCDQVATHAQTLDIEWDVLTAERRRTIAQRLLSAWRDEERADIVNELEALSTAESKKLRE